MSKLNKIIATIGGSLALDSIVIPKLTHGKTLHEITGYSLTNQKELFLGLAENLSACSIGAYFLLKDYQLKNKRNY